MIISTMAGAAIILRPAPAARWPPAETAASSRALREAAAAWSPADPPPSSAAAVGHPRLSAREESPPEKLLDVADNPARTRRREETCPRPEPRYRCRTCRRNWHTSRWR